MRGLLAGSADPSVLGLDHGPYVDALPDRAVLQTPLHFSPAERQLIQGTNMVSATEEREAAWRAEWERCASVLRKSTNRDLANALTW